MRRRQGRLSFFSSTARSSPRRGDTWSAVSRKPASAKPALVVLELNTPGGTLVALREMTAAITPAAPPVAVYVTPAGARAASASAAN